MIIIFKLAELNPPQPLSQSISFLPFRIESRANIDTIKLSRNLFFRGTNFSVRDIKLSAIISQLHRALPPRYLRHDRPLSTFPSLLIRSRVLDPSTWSPLFALLTSDSRIKPDSRRRAIPSSSWRSFRLSAESERERDREREREREGESKG